MSFELIYKNDDTGEVLTREVNPAGVYSLVTKRDNHRYKEEFNGEMTFMAADFDWIMEVPVSLTKHG